jgi:hypothetical protein
MTYDYSYEANAHVRAWRRSDEFRKRPFRFEDLNGRPEPKSWGPVYPNLAGVEKWRRLNRKRDLTDEETRAYGAAVGAAIRALNRPPRSGPISLKCTVQNTSGTDTTAEGEERRYRHWVEVRLPALRAERLAAEAAGKAAKERYWTQLASPKDADLSKARPWSPNVASEIASNVVKFRPAVTAAGPDRSAAARKAWDTRRAAAGTNAPTIAPKAASDRSAAALKAWETRRKKA